MCTFYFTSQILFPRECLLLHRALHVFPTPYFSRGRRKQWNHSHVYFPSSPLQPQRSYLCYAVSFVKKAIVNTAFSKYWNRCRNRSPSLSQRIPTPRFFFSEAVALSPLAACIRPRIHPRSPTPCPRITSHGRPPSIFPLAPPPWNLILQQHARSFYDYLSERNRGLQFLPVTMYQSPT